MEEEYEYSIDWEATAQYRDVSNVKPKSRKEKLRETPRSRSKTDRRKLQQDQKPEIERNIL